jgi:hypothetical protein
MFPKIDLNWLVDFQSDETRLVALIIFAIMVIIVGCARPITSALVQDRENKRKWHLADKRLQDQIDQRLKRLSKGENK